MSDGRKHIENAVANVPTWVESNSLAAQKDMRDRCMEAAGIAAEDVINKFSKHITTLQERIKELENLLTTEREFNRELLQRSNRFADELKVAQDRIKELDTLLQAEKEAGGLSLITFLAENYRKK